MGVPFLELEQWARTCANSLLAVVFVAFIEMIAPRTAYPIRARVLGVLFLITNGLIITTLIHNVWQHLWVLVAPPPIIHLQLDRVFGWAGSFATIPEIIVATLVADFFSYWYHRIQHVALWRFHALHHCVEDLHCASNYGHFSEDIFRTFLLLGPFSLVAIHRGPEPVFVALLIGYKESYIHAPTTASLGPLRYLITDNVYHRIHHSKNPGHFDKNFGIITPIWDIIFGTAYFPKRDEWPDTGLEGVPEPRTLRELFLFPLRGWRPKSRSTAA